MSERFKTQVELDRYLSERKVPQNSMYWGCSVAEANQKYINLKNSKGEQAMRVLDKALDIAQPLPEEFKKDVVKREPQKTSVLKGCAGKFKSGTSILKDPQLTNTKRLNEYASKAVEKSFTRVIKEAQENYRVEESTQYKRLADIKEMLEKSNTFRARRVLPDLFPFLLNHMGDLDGAINRLMVLWEQDESGELKFTRVQEKALALISEAHREMKQKLEGVA